MYWGEVEATFCKRGCDVKWLTTIVLKAGRSQGWFQGLGAQLDRVRSALAVLAGGINSLAFV